MKEQSFIRHQETPRIYRTEVPNIIFDMMELGLISNVEYTLYSVYRRIAGEEGACWVGTRGLEKKTGLSHPTIKKAKEILSKPFEILGDKSLIHIEKCDRKSGTADTVTIIDIWPENFKHFKKNTMCEKLRYRGVKNYGTGVCKIRAHKKQPNKKQQEEVVCVDPDPVDPPPLFKKIIVSDFEGNKISLTLQDLFVACIKHKKDWTEKEIDEAWKVLVNYKSPVRDWLKFCDGTIKNQRKLRKIKELEVCSQQEFPKSKDKQGLKNQSTITKEKCLEKDTSERHWVCLGDLVKPLKKSPGT